MAQDNKLRLSIIVNGQPNDVEANQNAPLRSVVGRALEATGNTGQPPENWEMRDAQGNLLDLDRKIGEFEFNADTRLFLNLKAGVGGIR